MKVAVIGLGIVGLSIAQRLSLAGHDVTGFEQFSPLHEKGSSHGDTRIFRLIPFEGDVYTHMAREAHAVWLEWSQQGGTALFNPVGHIDFAKSGGEWGTEAVLELYRKTQAPCQEMNLAQAAALFDSRIVLSNDITCLYQKDSGVLYADQTRQFLERSARENGTALHYNTKVTALDPIAKTVQTSVDVQAFDKIIIASGAWLSEFCPFVDNITLLRKYLGWFKQQDNAPTRWPTCITLYDECIYAMPTPDGGYKFGLDLVGDVIPTPDRRDADANDVTRLTDAILPVFPSLEQTPYRGAVCLYTRLPNDDFIIDYHPDSDDVLIFSCCSGHGFKFAPSYGLIAQRMIEEKEQPYDMRRFELTGKIKR